MLRLPRVAELRDGARLPGRDEDRVEAEALVACWRIGDAAGQHAGTAVLGAVGREQHELAHVARFPGGAVDGGERLLDVAALGPARRLHTRAATERGELDARIV